MYIATHVYKFISVVVYFTGPETILLLLHIRSSGPVKINNNGSELVDMCSYIHTSHASCTLLIKLAALHFLIGNVAE